MSHVSSDQIVGALWQHDPVFVEFSKSVLGAHTAEAAWDMLYTSDGVSKMTPSPSDLHIAAGVRATGKRGRPTGRKLADGEVKKLFDPLKISSAVIPGQRATGKVARKQIKTQIKATKKKLKSVHDVHQPYYQQQLANQRAQLKTTPKKPQAAPMKPVASTPTPAATAPTPAAPEKKPFNWKKPAIIGGAALGAGGATVLGAQKIKQNASGQYPQQQQEEFGYSEDFVPFSQTFEIVKANEKQQVFGWASVIEKDGKPVLDKQGDLIEPEEMENSAYKFVVESRKGGRQHRRDENNQPVHISDMIESFVITDEKKRAMGLPMTSPTGWWVGFKVNDPETWEDVKSGKVTSFSIHGRGRRVPVGQ